jgi:hypothetical protein
VLKGCPVVHTDETSVRIKVGLGWVHTVASPDYTYLAPHNKRGIDAIVDIGVLSGLRTRVTVEGVVDTRVLLDRLPVGIKTAWQKVELF